MKLIVGLGNPGPEYQNTRHNLGQSIILKLIEKQGLILKNYSKLSSQLAEIGQGSDKKVLTGFTNEYMNNSGIAVQKILNFYKIPPQDLYVIHDDLDLPVGEYKIQFNRGSAGHNGIKSIIENIKTQRFNRIRVGIGKPQNNIPAEDYVLLPFTKEEKAIIDNLIPEITTEINNLLEIRSFATSSEVGIN